MAVPLTPPALVVVEPSPPGLEVGGASVEAGVVAFPAVPNILPTAADNPAAITAKLPRATADVTLRSTARRSNSGATVRGETPDVAISSRCRLASTSSTDQAPEPAITSGVQAKRNTMSGP